MNCLRLVTVIVCLLMSAPAAFAQSAASSAPGEEEEARKREESKQKALALLNRLVEDARSLRLPENRVWVYALAGDMLWSKDEQRARELIGEAMNTFKQLFQQPEDEPGAIPEQFRWQLAQMRQDIVQMLGRRDLQLAGEFLAATRPSPQDSIYNAETENNLEVTLTERIAEQDPQRALRRAEEMLAAGKPPRSVASIIFGLRNKDLAAARRLTDQVVARLDAESTLSFESAYFALNLVSQAPPPKSNDDAEQARSLLTAASARTLLEKAIAAAQSDLAAANRLYDHNRRNRAMSLLSSLKSNSSYVEKYAPESLPALKRSWEEIEQARPPQMRALEDLNRLAREGSVDQMLEAAGKAPPDTRYHFYQRAANMAGGQGDIARARQIINQNITNPRRRQEILRGLDQQLFWKSVNEGKLEDARRLMAGMRDYPERFGALLHLAGNLSGAGQKEQAMKILAEAWKIVDGPAETNQEFNSQLQVAGAYVQLDPARAFEIIEFTIDRFDELLDATALLEGFDGSSSFREKEMLLRGSNRSSNYLSTYKQYLTTFAGTDMDRVQAVIKRFGRNEVRIQVQLAVLQQLL